MSEKYSYNNNCLAVTGMACRFPGVDTIEEFWDHLLAGDQTMKHIPVEELKQGVHGEICEREDYVPIYAGLNDISLFDADKFGYSPSEAEVMDPQQRLLLETVWHALENSCDATGDDEMRRTGVYTSCNLSSYLLNNLYARTLTGEVDILEASVGNNLDYIATRIAYKLDFHGPALNVQSACSSSLSALHVAAQSLLAGECDRAVVGSATLTVPTRLGYIYLPGGMRSPDGRCRPYDADALGTVFGNGVCAVVLKRLQNAIDDKDPIWAVVRGSAANNDGSMKMSFTAPSQDAQAEVIAEAIRMAGVSPWDISFIEGHGTATPMGDPIEVAALLQIFDMEEPQSDEDGVLLGSVKGNIGHLDCTAGLAGFIKAVLSLHHGVFPGTAHFKKLNPSFGNSIFPFIVTADNTELTEVPCNRLAGVSSFGFGGTNVHMILQGADIPPVAEMTRQENSTASLFLLSAPNEGLLNTLQEEMVASLENSNATPEDVAFSLATGREHGPARRILKTPADFNASPRPMQILEHQQRDVAFLFPGQGAQFPEMFRGEYESDVRFREIFEENSRNVVNAGGPDATVILQACWAGDPEAAASLSQTRIIQPVLFTLEISLAQRIMAMGVTPSCLIGHSLGEYVAACLAGVFSVGDCGKLLVARGKIMQKAPAGKMLAALLPREKLAQALGDIYGQVEIAVYNSKGNCVLCGSREMLEECRTALEAAGGAGIFLRTSHAFHTSSMDCVLDEFQSIVETVSLAPPQLPLVSNVTGTWAGQEMATPDYWTRHLCSAVRFDKGINTLFSRPVVGLELGPGQVLTSLILQELGVSATSITPFTGLNEAKDGHSGLTTALSELWLNGADIDWQAYYAGEERNLLHLPNTPLLRKSYWIDTALPMNATGSDNGSGSAPSRGMDGQQTGCTLDDMVTEESAQMHPRPKSLEYVPASNDMEEVMVGLWEATLHISPVGIHDPFIELGGNSLHILCMIRLAHEQDITLSIKDVFDGGTIAGLCEILAQHQKIDAARPGHEDSPSSEVVHANEQDMQTLMTILQK